MVNRLRGSALFKALALVVAAVSLTVAVMNTAAAIYRTWAGCDSHTYEDVRESLLDEFAYNFMYELSSRTYRETARTMCYTDEDIGALSYGKSFGFTIRNKSRILFDTRIKDGSGNCIDAVYEKSFGRAETADLTLGYPDDYTIFAHYGPDEYPTDYYGEFTAGMSKHDIFDDKTGLLELTVYYYENTGRGDIIERALDFWAFMYSYGAVFYIAAAVGAVLFLLSTAFLLAAAGHRRGVDGVVVSRLDRVPLAFVIAFAAAVVLGMALLYNLVDDIRWGYMYYMWDAAITIFITCALTVFTPIALGVMMTVVSRFKSRVFIKNTLLYRIARCVWRVLQFIPTFWRTLLVSVFLIFLSIIILMIGANSWDYGVAFMLCLLLGIALTVYACWRAYMMSRLLAAGRRIASGDLSYRVDVKSFHGDFRKHAETLGRIGDGIANAVEERMKGERFKTELITNVSHDLKTPLTSIVNYIDLLKQCDIENEDAKSYIEVLERQSDKLRRLTDDLIYASKASSGVMHVDLEMCDLSVLVEQTVGEYEERLEKCGLVLVVRNSDAPVYVMADGNHTSRIIDNLMSNVQKYSMPGTRVYLDLVLSDGYAGISLRNISREPITARGDELTERFVRGDASRHTEGSGLGLSIANSLAQLEGALLDISTDGDLFRATLWFERKDGPALPQ